MSCRRLELDESDFEGVGYCNQAEVVRARFGLKHFCVGQNNETPARVDQRIIEEARSRFALLRGYAQDAVGAVR